MSEVELIKNYFSFNSSIAFYLRIQSSEMAKRKFVMYVSLMKGQEIPTFSLFQNKKK